MLMLCSAAKQKKHVMLYPELCNVMPNRQVSLREATRTSRYVEINIATEKKRFASSLPASCLEQSKRNQSLLSVVLYHGMIVGARLRHIQTDATLDADEAQYGKTIPLASQSGQTKRQEEKQVNTTSASQLMQKHRQK